MNRVFLYFFAAGLSLFLGFRGVALAQDEVPEPPARPISMETYRLRVENLKYGKIEVSTDGGQTFLLIGRVLRPATTPSLDKTSKKQGVVLRASESGIAFSIAPGESLKLRPSTPAVPTSQTSSIVTNLLPNQSVFGNLRPLPGAEVRLQTGPVDLSPLPDGFTLSEEDTFTLLVSLPPANPVASSETQRLADWQAVVRFRFEEIAKKYTAGAAARARAEKRKVASGTLNLKAKLPTNEPDPIKAVIFTIDGQMVALQNAPPYTYAWNTREIPDGEYAVEISAQNSSGVRITHVRALVVVQNGKPK